MQTSQSVARGYGLGQASDENLVPDHRLAACPALFIRDGTIPGEKMFVVDTITKNDRLEGVGRML